MRKNIAPAAYQLHSYRSTAIKQLHETTTTTDGLHISAHNAVKMPPARERHWTLRQAYEMHLQRRDEGLKRGEKLAKKLGRPPPGKQERFDHWGYPVLLGGAFACPVFLTAAMYADDLARPEAMSGVNADGNIGGCVTGCGGLTQCGATTGNLGGGSGFGAGGGASGAVTDMFDASYYDDGGGGDGGESPACAYPLDAQQLTW